MTSLGDAAAADAAAVAASPTAKDLFRVFTRSSVDGNDTEDRVIARVQSLIDAGVDVDACESAEHHELGSCRIVLASIGQHAQRMKNNHGGIRDAKVVLAGLRIIIKHSKNVDGLVNDKSFANLEPGAADSTASVFRGLTPLIWASMVGSIDLVRFLIRYGADVKANAPGLRLDALRGACMFNSAGSSEVVAFLEEELKASRRCLRTTADVVEWVMEFSPFFASPEWIGELCASIQAKKMAAGTFFSMLSPSEYLDLVMSEKLQKLKAPDLDGTKVHWVSFFPL